jgi:hypothetical protein
VRKHLHCLSQFVFRDTGDGGISRAVGLRPTSLEHGHRRHHPPVRVALPPHVLVRQLLLILRVNPLLYVSGSRPSLPESDWEDMECDLLELLVTIAPRLTRSGKIVLRIGNRVL